MSFGKYPTVSLKDARQKRGEAKEQLAEGIDPGEQRKEAKAVAVAQAREQAAAFEAVGRDEKRPLALDMSTSSTLYKRCSQLHFEVCKWI